MQEQEGRWHAASLWRMLHVLALAMIWLTIEASSAAFAALLLLLLLIVLRWRFALPWWTVLLDGAVCAGLSGSTDLAVYGLAVLLFECMLAGRMRWSLLMLPGLLLPAMSLAALIYIAQSGLVGYIIYRGRSEEQRYRQDIDEQRRARHELERIRSELLEASQAAAQQAELLARYRMSRQLHDHLGHDLTGAELALQAYAWVDNPEEGEALLAEVRHRLARSTVQLRHMVHNTTPTGRIGVEVLEQVIADYRGPRITYARSGDMQQVSAYVWPFLESLLKEALTNVARHSEATQIRIALDVNPQLVRLLIHDNGVRSTPNPASGGLRSLQMRARAMGGSLSIGHEDGFLLVGVVPLDREEKEDDEIADRR